MTGQFSFLPRLKPLILIMSGIALLIALYGSTLAKNKKEEELYL
jgi:hypothetical protein